MSNEPQIQQRAEQPYAGMRLRVTMQGLSGAVDAGFPELFGWLAEHGIAPAGPPFIRYHVIDMEGELDIELGVPAEVTDTGEARVRPGALPAGQYAVLRHTGPYHGLIDSNAALQRWAGTGSRWTAGTYPAAARGAGASSTTTSPTRRPSPTRRGERSTSPA